MYIYHELETARGIGCSKQKPATHVAIVGICRKLSKKRQLWIFVFLYNSEYTKDTHHAEQKTEDTIDRIAVLPTSTEVPKKTPSLLRQRAIKFATYLAWQTESRWKRH